MNDSCSAPNFAVTDNSEPGRTTETPSTPHVGPPMEARRPRKTSIITTWTSPCRYRSARRSPPPLPCPRAEDVDGGHSVSQLIVFARCCTDRNSQLQPFKADVGTAGQATDGESATASASWISRVLTGRQCSANVCLESSKSCDADLLHPPEYQAKARSERSVTMNRPR
jgi:hypothetical protein